MRWFFGCGPVVSLALNRPAIGCDASGICTLGWPAVLIESVTTAKYLSALAALTGLSV